MPLPTATDGAAGDVLGGGVPLAGGLVRGPREARVPPEKPELKTTAATPMTMSASAAQDRPVTIRRLGCTNSQLRLRRISSSLPGYRPGQPGSRNTESPASRPRLQSRAVARGDEAG
jgi:hypothetical protein